MTFLYREWEKFCRALAERGIRSTPIASIEKGKETFFVLKHDVETNVPKAYHMAQIEHHYGHRGSYYVQAYLLLSQKNIILLEKIKEMGHEVSYHHDVMDCCKGNLQDAIVEFEKNKNLFEKNGFPITTVCQHGNPIVDRVGYTSNRDFFRNANIREKYDIVDVMVNLKDDYQIDYAYYSDAGRKFKWIFDPINNDIINSDDKNISYDDLNHLLKAFNFEKSIIVSTHPHRWSSSWIAYQTRNILFKFAKTVAKLCVKIPLIKRVMNRYYYLAKKI